MPTSLIPAALIVMSVIVLFVVMSLASVLVPGEPDQQDFTAKTP